MDVNQAIKFLRTSKGMTQEEVASRIGVSKASIANIESNRAKPSPKNLVALADLFNVKSTDLLAGKVGIEREEDMPAKATEAGTFAFLKEENERLWQHIRELTSALTSLSKLLGNNNSQLEYPLAA